MPLVLCSLSKKKTDTVLPLSEQTSLATASFSSHFITRLLHCVTTVFTAYPSIPVCSNDALTLKLISLVVLCFMLQTRELGQLLLLLWPYYLELFFIFFKLLRSFEPTSLRNIFHHQANSSYASVCYSVVHQLPLAVVVVFIVFQAVS